MRDIRTSSRLVPRPYVAFMTDQRQPFAGGALFVTGYILLAALFGGLGIYYLANPSGAMNALSATNQRLGGIPIHVVDVVAWRYTAAVGMITLGVMCLMILIDLRRNSSMLVPLVFFKGFDIVLLVRYSVLHPHVPACYQFAAMDAVLIACALGLALPARRRLMTADTSQHSELAAERVPVGAV
jgi:hypothetical protein